MERTLGPDLAWEACDARYRAAVLRELQERAPRIFADAEIASARQLHLPFYAKHVLVDAVVEDVPGVERALLLRGPTGTIWPPVGNRDPRGQQRRSLRLDRATCRATCVFLFVLREGRARSQSKRGRDHRVAGRRRWRDRATARDRARAVKPLQLGANDADGRFRLDRRLRTPVPSLARPTPSSRRRNRK